MRDMAYTGLFIDQLLARRAEPGRVALRWKDGGALDQCDAYRLRDGLAGWLVQAGIAPGQRVAIVLPKGPAAALALFAVLQIGAVAAVLDAEAPVARLRLMLNELAPRLVLTTDALNEALFGTAPSVIALAPNTPSDLPQAAVPVSPAFADDDPALILMTSGSTGTPKGVMLSHGNLSSFIHWAVAQFGLKAQDRFLSLAPLHFDLSILDLYASQMIGAEVYLTDAPATRMPGAVALAAAAILPTVLYAVPTQLQMLARVGFFATSAGARDLRWVLSAGEVLTAPLVARIMGDAPQLRMANLYGPTETNVIACHMIDSAPDPQTGPLPIGLPCPHAEITLSPDPDTDPTIGELCVTGPSVMLGYTNSDMPCPNDAPRSYATGDILRQDADGVLHFVGRRDGQVKLHGQRFELGDVEAAAMRLGHISAAAAVLLHPANSAAAHPGQPAPKLALCVVAQTDAPTPHFILQGLAKTLPKAALPKLIRISAFLPQTSSGKTDKALLRQRLEKEDNAKS